MKDLEQGTFTGPVRHIGLRPPAERSHPKATAARVPEDRQEKTFLRALEEPPEGLGSKPPPLPAPLEEPPVEPPPLPPPLEEPLGEAAEGLGSLSLLSPQPAPPEDPFLPPPPPDSAPAELARSKGEQVMHKIAEAPAMLAEEEYRSLENEFIAVAKPEDLRTEDKEAWESVRYAGLGLCSRCRWLSGCDRCDEGKAWDFACRSTLWHTAHEAVRPKAKPKGRPPKRPEA